MLIPTQQVYLTKLHVYGTKTFPTFSYLLSISIEVSDTVSVQNINHFKNETSYNQKPNPNKQTSFFAHKLKV